MKIPIIFILIILIGFILRVYQLGNRPAGSTWDEASLGYNAYVWKPLHGKRISIRVRDAGVAFHFTLDHNGLAARSAVAQPDLAISTSAQDFVLLTLRKEDPDTLFFSRRLVMEGNTDLGLVVKHTLDVVDWPQFAAADLLPHRALPLIARLALRRKG